MHISIIGAGISGLLSAYFLLKEGHTVEMIESASNVASQASGANAAQLSYTYVNPIGSPSLLKLLPSIVLGKNQGMRIRSYDTQLVQWGLQLLLQSLPSRFVANRSALLALSLQSKQLFEELKDDTGIAFTQHHVGKIQLLHTKQLCESARRFQQELALHDVEQKWLDHDAIHQKLSGFNLTEEPMGTIYSPIDETADCPHFCHDLLVFLQKQKGFKIHFNTRFEQWEKKGKRLHALISNDGKTFKADHFLLCTGALTNHIVKPLGLSFPIYPVKGYTLVYEYDAPIACSVTDHAQKIVFVPLEKQLLVSGMFHLDGHNTHIDSDTVSHIHACAQNRLPELADISHDVRCGLRPCTPSSTPIIKQTDYRNLYINSGQGMYGWTLSTASAKHASDIICAA